MCGVHVNVCSQSIIYKGIRLADVKSRVSCITGVTNQGNSWEAKGKAFSEGSMADIRYKGIFQKLKIKKEYYISCYFALKGRIIKNYQF